MSVLSRRHFLSLTGSAATAALSGRLTTPAKAAMGPADKFDLVIKGGEVVDPSQSLRGKRDVGIRWGVVEAIEADIPAARATKSIDASGKLVLPACSPVLPCLPLWLRDRHSRRRVGAIPGNHDGGVRG